MSLPHINIDLLDPTEPILVSWGGGIDSTYALKWLLENTQNPIYADYWGILSDRLSDFRMIGEKGACDALYPLLSQIRPFTYTTFQADWKNCWARGPAVISLVQQSAQTRRIKKMVIGAAHDDLTQLLPNTDISAITKMVQFGEDIAAAWERMQDYLDPALQHTTYCRFALLPESATDTKFNYGLYLGKELVELTFSCTNSVALQTSAVLNNLLKSCGQCPRCLAREQLLAHFNQ
jgi:7-cyano-7-deazaguanine synthase in queuosine biosynthesis